MCMYGTEELVAFRRIEVLIVVLDVRSGAFLLRHIRQPFLFCAAVIQADHDFHLGKTVCQSSYLQQQILSDFGACPLQQVFVELCIIWQRTLPVRIDASPLRWGCRCKCTRRFQTLCCAYSFSFPSRYFTSTSRASLTLPCARYVNASARHVSCDTRATRSNTAFAVVKSN